MSEIFRLKNSSPVLGIVVDAINKQFSELNTTMPAIVKAYDKDKNRAEIEPAYPISYRHGVMVEIPPLKNIPVLFLGGDNMQISFDLKNGDRGVLIFSQRSLEEWKADLETNATAKQRKTQQVRKHHFADGMFMPTFIDKVKPAVVATQQQEQATQDLSGFSSVASQLSSVTTNGQAEIERLQQELNALPDPDEQGISDQVQATRQRAKDAAKDALDAQIMSFQQSLNNLSSRLGDLTNDFTSGIENSLDNALSGLTGGLLGGIESRDKKFHGGNRLIWEGQLDAGNANDSLLQSYNELHDQTMLICRALMTLSAQFTALATASSFIFGPAAPLMSVAFTSSATALSASITPLIQKILSNKIKLSKLLK